MSHLCPACHRINDKAPAGIVVLDGRTVASHADELIHLARRQEEAEKAEHPLNRIMDVEVRAPDEIAITTTEVHLAVRIGDAIQRAFKGDLTEKFDDACCFIRVTWQD
jgi:hypothetical protein